MCFSAEASFGAGIVLSAIGIATIKKVSHKSQLMFAGIPFLFAFQQFSEGMLWIYLKENQNQDAVDFFKYLFLFFAQVLWPLWVPTAFLLLEKNGNLRKLITLTLLVGLTVSLYLGYCLLNYKVTVAIVDHHIQYTLFYAISIASISGILYVTPTVIPPFISSIQRTTALGAIILVSYITTKIFYDQYVISIWCFFAAILSAAVYWVMLNLKKVQLQN